MSSVIPTTPISGTSQAAIYAERGMAMMQGLGLLPTPKNYAIFFACAAGQPTELVQEIETLVGKKQYLSEEILDQLYNRYIAAAQTRVVQDTTAHAKKILNDMMSNVSAFTSSTTTVSQDVAQQLKQLDGEAATEEMVRLLAGTLVQSAQVMQDSSEQMTARLADAQQEIAALREDLARVTTESDRDFLTGCFNRKAFDRRLQEALEEAKTKESELTLLMLDIDHFKHFNDNFGHQIGDEVLKIVAKTLIDLLKGMDCVARYGGEEFAVILPRTPIGGGMIVAETIRKTIAGKELKRRKTGENFGAITVSIGVAAFRHHGHDSPASLLHRADETMYRSKKAGRNRVTQEHLGD